jgi:hypothetical protein
VHKGKFFLVLLTSGILSAGNANSQRIQEYPIAKDFRGKATWDEKKQLGRLFNDLANLAQDPDEITLAKVVATTRAQFKEPVCFPQKTGAKSCSYDNVNWDVRTFTVSGLRTISKDKESDMGAQVRMQIAQKYVCVPTKAVDKFWHVKPIQGPALVPDSFGNSDAPTGLIKTTFYKGINPSAPHVYVETKSIAGCVVDVTLSTIRQPI